jgi:hypothetical protein
MNAFENYIVQTFPADACLKAETLRLAVLAGTGLLVALVLAATYGLDLSPGFF